jgi:phosphoglycerate dehydrogenase-like enzyme
MGTILIGLENEVLSQKQMETIQAICPESRIVVTNKREEIEPLLEEIEVAAGHFPVQWIPRTPKLRWYQQWGAGTDWLLRHPEIAERDFILTNASGVHSIPISEHILAMMLAFARHLPNAVRAQERREWTRNMGAFELAEKKLLLIGVGAIGKRTAQICSALGMHVTGMRRNPSKSLPDIDRMVGPDELHDALAEADFVVLTIPLTEETRHMIDAQAFEKMKSSAYILNIGRGGTIDEGAMIHALQNGQIAGAGLDVFETEPLPADSPLWAMENVLITAHYSGDTPHYDDRALEIFIDNLERYANNQTMRNVVDKEAGY